SRGGGLMRCSACVCLLICLSSVFALAAQERPRPRPIEKADTVIAIYSQDWGLASAGNPTIILAIWPDGRVVWSKDRLCGGSPYFTGQVDPEVVETLVSRFEKDGLFA